MFKILKKLTGKELRYVGISLIFIITQVYLDLKLPDYMSKVTKLIKEKERLFLRFLIKGNGWCCVL